MKIEAKYWATEKFLPTNRHRNERCRYVYGTTEVEINEPKAEEFPVAFIVSEYETRFKDGEDGQPESIYGMCDTEIRAFNNKLWKAVLYSDKQCRAAGWWPVSNLHYSFETERPYPYNKDNLFDPEKSIITETNEDECIKGMHQKASHYLVFDNKVWSQCGEPCYTIMTFGLGHNRGGTGFFIKYIKEPHDKGILFNALNRDVAIAYGKQVALGRGDDESVPCMGEHENIKVCMPQMVRINNPEFLPKGTRYCPVCGYTERFITTAHIAQDWLVDGKGNFIKTIEDCTEVVASPNNDNIWSCYMCGAETVVKE